MTNIANNSNLQNPMEIKSSAFGSAQPIPAEYTCDGKSINPPLEFSNVPADAKSLALTLKDPDAPGGNFTHWVVWNIPPQTSSINPGDALPGAVQGLNGANRTGYTGPCPPSGVHRYFFRLYALDGNLNLDPNSGDAQLDRAMAGHIISQSELIGIYKKK